MQIFSSVSSTASYEKTVKLNSSIKLADLAVEVMKVASELADNKTLPFTASDLDLRSKKNSITIFNKLDEKPVARVELDTKELTVNIEAYL